MTTLTPKARVLPKKAYSLKVSITKASLIRNFTLFFSLATPDGLKAELKNKNKQAIQVHCLVHPSSKDDGSENVSAIHLSSGSGYHYKC